MKFYRACNCMQRYNGRLTVNVCKKDETADRMRKLDASYSIVK